MFLDWATSTHRLTVTHLCQQVSKMLRVVFVAQIDAIEASWARLPRVVTPLTCFYPWLRRMYNRRHFLRAGSKAKAATLAEILLSICDPLHDTIIAFFARGCRGWVTWWGFQLHFQASATEEAIARLAPKYSFRFIGGSTTRSLARNFASIVTGHGPPPDPSPHTRVDFSRGDLKV